MIGRERELELLDQGLQRTLAGQGNTVLVGGEAGIGKTHLVRRLREQALDAGSLVLEGNSYDQGTSPPYGPWRQIHARLARSYLAHVYLASGMIDAALESLEQTLSANRRAETLIERKCWAARASVALGTDDPDLAISIADHLPQTTKNHTEIRIVPLYSRLRGEALAQIVVVVFYPGDIGEGQQLVNQLRTISPPLLDEVGPMPYRDWQMAFDEEFPHGRRYYWKGVLLNTMSDEVIDAILDHGVDAPLPNALIALEHYRGAMNRVDPAATAFSNRDANYQIVIIGGSEDAEDDTTSIKWARSLNAAAQPYSTQAAFLNFNSVEGTEKEAIVRAGFGTNYDRLVDIKRRYDPANFFAENNNISPD